MKLETEKICYPILSIRLFMFPANTWLFPTTYSLGLSLPSFKLLPFKIYISFHLLRFHVPFDCLHQKH